MTAREFFDNQIEDERYDGQDYTDCMIEFARYHVEKALQKACEEVNGRQARGGIMIFKNTIIEAYSLENIK